MRRKIANARIDLRITPQKKYFLELAAFIGGYDSLSSFIGEASDKLARYVLAHPDDSRELSAKDRDLLLNLLKKSPAPNAKLKATFKKISKLYYLNENDCAIYDIDPCIIKDHIHKK